MKKKFKYYLLSIMIYGVTFVGVNLLLGVFFRAADDRSFFLILIISAAVAQLVSPMVKTIQSQSGEQIELWWVFLKKKKRIQ